MSKIKRSALVHHSAESMYQLVLNISEYPDFLPWCHTAEVIEQNTEEQIGRLEIKTGPISQSFTTKNKLSQNHSIQMSFLEGKLEQLTGVWLFEPICEDACKITLELEFKLSQSWSSWPLMMGSEVLANKMVTAFCQQANKVLPQPQQ